MSTDPLHRLTRVMALINVALPYLDALPPQQRADVYEGIADATQGLDVNMSTTAARIADQLREAELGQLHFRNLFAKQP